MATESENKSRRWHAFVEGLWTCLLAGYWPRERNRQAVNPTSRRVSLLMRSAMFNRWEKGRLTKFKDRHAGQCCWIIGNGPSLNETNVELLSDQFTFIVNGFILHKSCKALRPSYYIANNLRLMESDFFRYDILPELIDMEMTCFVNYKAKPMISRKFRKHEKIYYLLTTEQVLLSDENYNLDVTKLLFGSRVTVIVKAVIPLAVYMGFKRIYLVGCDCDYYNFENNRRHFYREDVTENLAKLNRHALELFPEYYKNPEETAKRLDDNFVYEYRVASEFLKRLGVTITNCTVGGKLEVLPRRMLEAVLQEERDHG